MTYFKNIKSLADLKNQFKVLAKANHPDAGGDADVMKAINAEYDQLFVIWKVRSGDNSSDTADSTRREFYTQYGWKGSNYDYRRSLTEVSALVRAYVREKYPRFKFSVTKSAYNSLHVVLKEGYTTIVSDGNNLEDAYGATYSKYRHWNDGFYTKEAQEMMDDINAFVSSYNYEDIDAQIDYFAVGFWFHGVGIAYGYTINPKLADKKAKCRKVVA